MSSGTDMTLVAVSCNGSMDNDTTIEMVCNGSVPGVVWPTARPVSEDYNSWDDATWILTSAFVIFTMQSGESLPGLGPSRPEVGGRT